eukprot:1947986-Amphidinium_carterae.2
MAKLSGACGQAKGLPVHMPADPEGGLEELGFPLCVPYLLKFATCFAQRPYPSSVAELFKGVLDVHCIGIPIELAFLKLQRERLAALMAELALRHAQACIVRDRVALKVGWLLSSLPSQCYKTLKYLVFFSIYLEQVMS